MSETGGPLLSGRGQVGDDQGRVRDSRESGSRVRRDALDEPRCLAGRRRDAHPLDLHGLSGNRKLPTVPDLADRVDGHPEVRPCPEVLREPPRKRLEAGAEGEEAAFSRRWLPERVAPGGERPESQASALRLPPRERRKRLLERKLVGAPRPDP